jgi:hypothetical protein
VPNRRSRPSPIRTPFEQHAADDREGWRRVRQAYAHVDAGYDGPESHLGRWIALITVVMVAGVWAGVRSLGLPIGGGAAASPAVTAATNAAGSSSGPAATAALRSMALGPEQLAPLVPGGVPWTVASDGDSSIPQRTACLSGATASGTGAWLRAYASGPPGAAGSGSITLLLRSADSVETAASEEAQTGTSSFQECYGTTVVRAEMTGDGTALDGVDTPTATPLHLDAGVPSTTVEYSLPGVTPAGPRTLYVVVAWLRVGTYRAELTIRQCSCSAGPPDPAGIQSDLRALAASMERAATA